MKSNELRKLAGLPLLEDSRDDKHAAEKEEFDRKVKKALAKVTGGLTESTKFWGFEATSLHMNYQNKDDWDDFLSLLEQHDDAPVVTVVANGGKILFKFET